MDGGKPPGPSQQEKQAQASQAELLDLFRRQLEQQQVESRFFQPLLFESLGLTPEYSQVAAQMSGAQLKTLLGGKAAKKAGIDPSTMYTLEDALGFAGDNADLQAKIQGRFESIQPTQQLSGLGKKPETADELKRKEISGLSLDRELAALRGELPINPGLLSDLDKQESQLKESLRKQLGSGWETSSPGIEGLKSFTLMKNTVLDNARRGDLTLADALQSNALGQQMGQQGQFFGLGAGASQLPFGNVSGYAQAAQGFGGMAQQMANQRLAQYQMGGQGGFGGALGTLAGILGGSLTGGIGTAMGGSIGTKLFD